MLLGAGVLAGAVGSAGGITSLISYPALLAVGIPPLAANVTNAVALVANWPGSALGSRPELEGQGAWIWRRAPLTAAGAVAGAALLLCTPAGSFEHVVPYLVALGSVLLLCQPRISTWRESRLGEAHQSVLPFGLFVVSLYDGYFGAGAGVMTLALLLLTVHGNVAQANALKNALLGVADFTAAIGFVVFGPVHWAAAVPLAAGVLGGSTLGPSVTRRVPGNAIRLLAAAAGLGLAIHLWLAA